MKTRFFFISLLLCIASIVLAEDMPYNFYACANGLMDGQLKDTLKALIRSHTAIPYGNGTNSTWGVFYYSDRDEEGYCMDMYCDTWYKFAAPGSSVTGCNIEHSFAKSWWGGAENDAYKDCYHLNPSNSTANSSRSNYPLGIPVKDFKSNTGSLKVGKIHHDSLDVDFFVFEPKDEYKGDFARAYFYMATCYGRWSNGTIDPVCNAYKGWRLDNKDVGSKFAMQNDNYLEFQPWEQEVLIAWHRQDPVSIKEIRRQDAVSNFQHNRNPFIDYPYLAEYIWGEHAGEAVDMSLLMASSDDDFVPGISNGLRDSVTPAPKPKHSVTWMVNSEVLYVDSVIENKKIQTLPTIPVSCSSESSEFMGWTTATIDSLQDEAPDKLYTMAKEIPSVTSDIVLYAVFAKKTVIEGGESATYIFDDDHQSGWTTNAENKSGYWLLDQGKNLVSPEINLAGLSSITVHIRTYGGTQYNTLTVSANDVTIATITTNTGSTITEYTWNNSGSLTGNSSLTFSTDYGNKQGIGLESAVINATGTRILFNRYITSCQNETEVKLVEINEPARKVLIGNRIYIQVGDRLYTITGQQVK